MRENAPAITPTISPIEDTAPSANAAQTSSAPVSIRHDSHLCHGRPHSYQNWFEELETKVPARSRADSRKWLRTCAVAALWLLHQQPGIAVQATFGPTGGRPVTVPAFDAEPRLQWTSSREEYDATRAHERRVVSALWRRLSIPATAAWSTACRSLPASCRVAARCP